MRELNKEAMFLKDSILGNTKTMRNRIITLIPFLSFIIAKETTMFGSRLKFVVFMRLKKNETSRSKRLKVMIVRR